MTMAESAVFARWLAGEQPQTIAEIASEIGVSESTLRKHAGGRVVEEALVAGEHAGAPRGCRVVHVERARSGMTGPGYYRATCWVPSEARIRERMQALIARVELSKRDRAEMEARG